MSNVGTNSAAILNFVIPRGERGYTGSSGAAGGKFENVAAMVGDLELTAGTYAQTLGYYTAGDGGAGTYLIVPGGTGTADGGSFITLSNSLQAQALFPNNVVRLSQFGAVGDYAVMSNVPTSLGGWTDLGNGVYELTVAGYNANPAPLVFTLTSGKTYTFSYTKAVNTNTINNGYELDWYYDDRLLGGQYHQDISNGLLIVDTLDLAYTPPGPTFQVRIRGNANYTVGWTRLSSISIAQATSDLPALTAALAWFGTNRAGTLVIDAPTYFFLTDPATVTTIPSNVTVRVEGQGVFNINAPLVINSLLIADNRPIFPKLTPVTFGPQQRSVLSTWFGL